MTRATTRLFMLGAFALTANSCGAWYARGHRILSEASLHCLPREVPAFFRAGSAVIARYASEPDVFRNEAVPVLTAAERPEHFVNWEEVGDMPLPPSRYEFSRTCLRRRVPPETVGFLPYAVAEWTERLSMAFAEHRRAPEDPVLRNTCLLYAGMLAHYAQEVSQPLHVTVHFNGRMNPDGSSPRSGIHGRMDRLIEAAGIPERDLLEKQEISAFPDLLASIREEIRKSHSLVDRVYELENSLPPEEGPWSASPAVLSLARQQARSSVRFTACLYLTAWEMSQRILLPSWMGKP